MRLMTILALAVCLLLGGLVQAGEIKGKVKIADSDKSTITVTVDDKDQTLSVAKDAKITQLVGKNLKKAQPQDVAGGLNGLSTGSEVTLTTIKIDGKDLVTQVKVEGLAAKKKKKNQ
jgi:hypothetical protein